MTASNSNRASIPSAFFAPRYWPTWLLLGIMRLFALLPYRLLLLLGSGLGMLAYFILPSRRRIVDINLQLCFPERDEQTRQSLSRECFRALGITVMETALAWWGAENKLRKLYQIEGLEYIQQAQKNGQPILLLSGHMASTEIGARLLAFETSFQAMYKPAKNKLFEHVMLYHRNRFYHEMVPRKQSRQLLRNLKNHITTWYAPDQNFGHDDTVFAPFFGTPAITLTATARIAKFANAVVIPFFPYRLPNGQGYKLVISAPLENFPRGDDLVDTTQVNQAIENAVRVMPAQYLWAHKRFRHQPDGKPQRY